MTYRIKQSVKRTVVLMALAICALGSESLSQVNLRCEYLVNPLGVDAQKPRLSWVIEERSQESEFRIQNAESNRQNSGPRGVKQSAYQVLVASSEELLKQDKGDLWDSGKVKSDATAHIEYGGKPLPSRQQCFWKVKSWLSDGTTAESKSATWEMGLLKPEEWKAQWVEGAGYTKPTSLTIVRATFGHGEKVTDVKDVMTGMIKEYTFSARVGPESFKIENPAPGKPQALDIEYILDGKTYQRKLGQHIMFNIPEPGLPSVYLRKSLNVDDKPIAKARLYITALGLYMAKINGQRVGDVLFSPEWTDYKKRIRYQVYDVTSMLQKGENVLGVLVGHGWYSGTIGNENRQYWGNTPALFSQLEVSYKDGTTQSIVSDESWKQNACPIIYSDFMMGECYDARREIKGWDAPGLDDSTWKPVKTRAEAPRPLESQVAEPVRKIVELKPKTLTEPKPGRWTFDLGQNMVGLIRLKVSAPAGTTLTLRHGEMLNPDGTVYTENLRTADSVDFYTCKGEGEEVFMPLFTFHGFRYFELTGLTEKPSIDAVTGVVIGSDSPVVGEFSCSDPRVNQLYSNLVWGQRGNFLSVPTDCPQRNERLGWMGDAQVFVRTATYNNDVAGFFTKWMIDVDDAQVKDGAFTDISPRVQAGQGSPAWADAGVIVPWTFYQVYGDLRQLEQHYSPMVRWIEFCRTNSTDLVRDKFRGSDYGDWLSIASYTPKDIIGTAYFAYSTKLVAQAAKALGKTEDAAKYEQLFQDIRAAFNKKYVNAEGHIQAAVVRSPTKTTIDGNTQTAYAMAIMFDLLSDDLKAKVTQNLVDDIAAKKDHLSTGFVGVSYLLPALTRVGRNDTAYKLLLQDTFPSWLFSVKYGATTMWERWNGWTPEGFSNPGMNSFNHFAFGSCGEWMFATMAGIDTDGPGFKKLIIRPTPGEGITWVKASYKSIHGRIVSNWAVEGGKLNIEVTVPVNTTAKVYVPTKDAATVTESGKPAAKAKGVKLLRQDGDRAVYEVGSGTYKFESTAK